MCWGREPHHARTCPFFEEILKKITIVIFLSISRKRQLLLKRSLLVIFPSKLKSGVFGRLKWRMRDW
jgi:hypothetical protein